MRITARGWGWRHAGRSSWAVRDLDLSIEAGERVLLLGASGSGKSTLMLALAGVLGGAEEGEEQGQLLLDGTHPSRLVGRSALVQQDPESQVILSKVGDDVAFGCENLATPRELIWPKVRSALDAVGLNVGLDHPTAQLSGGQQQRLALAGAIAMQGEGGRVAAPQLILLDEPTANLDPGGAREVRDVVAAITFDRSQTLVVVEHRVDLWADLVDRVVVLAAGGGLLADGPPGEVFTVHRNALLAAGAWVPGTPVDVRPRGSRSAANGSILDIHGLSIGYAGHPPVQGGLQLQIPSGTSTVITGPNGSGKTTLAMTLAGLRAPLAGRVVAAPQLQPKPVLQGRFSRRRSLADPLQWTSKELLTRIGTVFQQPGHQFVASSVRDELAVGLRALSWTPEQITVRVDDLLELLHLTGLDQANPFTLSGGEQRRLSVATVLATAPAVIVLDEPTFGQDRATWTDLVGLVMQLLNEGSTIISVTHDPEYIALLGEHQIALEVGR